MKHRQASNGRKYTYTAHRIGSVSYDDALSTVYHYNAYGQPDSVYDESGVMCYEYGNMGEVTKETRIYALPFLSQPLALSTLFEYDSWGRILNITYPDNEIVNYDYDLGGQLFRMYNNSSYNYLDNIIYDKFGAKISQDYGNGIVTQYTYNDTTRRLSEIATNNGALINYTYDLIGNVTQVNSTCPWLNNQTFSETFTYDASDQLTAAQESQNNGYQLAVNYGNWGKVNNYNLTQTDFINNTSTGDSRLFTYPSDPNNLQVAQTMFAPEQCNGSVDVLFSFGINGSLRKREITQPQQQTEYYLFNSQGNLKAYSDDVMSFAYYGYNAANTRTYKLSLYNTNLWINGQQQPLNLQLQNAMFYPNTYLNFDAFGNYTKHYYNGMERIASRLGDNTTTIAINNNILEDRKLQLEEQFRVDIHKLIYETVPIDLPPFIDVNALQPTGTPNDIYYYHPNHLGSTSFVTDQNQTITQGFLYAPFGEITTEYNINFGSSVIPKYAFNAKELDEETGMYYYEARYYKPPVFTSRDPMFEKYFWMTPYAYCANNPVKYVDPSGEEMWHPDGEGNLIADEGDDYNTLKTYLVNIYGDEDKISTEEWESFSSQINSAIGANGAAEIAGMKLTSKNGTFENLVGKFLVTRFNENQYWGLPEKPEYQKCSPTTFNRVNFALEFVYGKSILGKIDWDNPIYRSWNGNPSDIYPVWGSPIISFFGLGKTVTDFQNDLNPGAIIGLQGHGGGHSTIFIRYSEDGNGFYEWGNGGEYYRNFNDEIVNKENGKSIKRGTNFY